MVDGSIPSKAARSPRILVYGISSPLSVRSMNVRTPVRRRESSLGRCGSVGVHGYSQASNSGVAQ